MKLTTLDIAVNKLVKFENLDHLKLRELWLNWNNLENSEENREYLKSFTALETIYLADNPMSQEDNYQQMLTNAVPSLQQIDGNMLRLGNPFHHQRTVGIHSAVKKEIPQQAKQILQEVIEKSGSQGPGIPIGSSEPTQNPQPEA